MVSIPIAMESTRMAWHWRSPAIPLVEVWRNSVEALRGSLPNVAACGKHPLFQQEDRGNKKCNIAFGKNWEQVFIILNMLIFRMVDYWVYHR